MCVIVKDNNWEICFRNIWLSSSIINKVNIGIFCTFYWTHTFLFWRAGRLKLLVFHFHRNFIVLHTAEEGPPGACTQSRGTDWEVSLDLQTGYKHKIVKHVITHTETHIQEHIHTQIRQNGLLLASMSRSRGYNSVADNCSFTFPMSLWWT